MKKLKLVIPLLIFFSLVACNYNKEVADKTIATSDIASFKTSDVKQPLLPLSTTIIDRLSYEIKCDISPINNNLVETINDIELDEFYNITDKNNFFNFGEYIVYFSSLYGQNSYPKSVLKAENTNGDITEILTIHEYITSIYWVDKKTICINFDMRSQGNFIVDSSKTIYFDISTGIVLKDNLEYPQYEQGGDIFGKNIWYRGKRFVLADSVTNEGLKDIYLFEDDNYKLLCQDVLGYNYRFANDKLYFSQSLDSPEIKIVSVDFNDNTKVIKTFIANDILFNITDDYLIYRIITKEKIAPITTVENLKNGKLIKINGFINHGILLLEDKKLYLNNLETGVVCIDESGTINRITSDLNITSLNVIGDKLYYSLREGDSSDVLYNNCYRMSLQSGKTVKL